MGYRYSNSKKKCTCKQDDCWDAFEECKKEQEEQNKKCDCCCVQGIKDELKKLVNRAVRINTESNEYAGTVTSVTCDVVKLTNSAGVVTIISVCKIEAIVPLLT
ncbi:exosporium protein ExsK [Bacillus luti]|uniref:exosporium protein ExsK n=1 Tax=Bacillus luti TaxID=2026191 RepID=UPI00289A8D0A|nr:exosporium protein ExsK [Bacillus luti]